MNQSTIPFEGHNIRRIYDEESETWFFSIVDIVAALTDSVNPTDYLKKLRKRDLLLGEYMGTNCPHVEMPGASGKKRKVLSGSAQHILRIVQSITSPKAEQEWAGMTVKQHKELKSQNLRDHMNEAELIFTALAEMSTRQIAEAAQATGFEPNKKASKRGGNIAKKARHELEEQTGKSVITNENYLPQKSKNDEFEDL